MGCVCSLGMKTGSSQTGEVLIGEVLPPSVPTPFPPTPFDSAQVTIPKAEYIQLCWEANYWKAQHNRATKQIGELKTKIEELLARIRDLTKRFFGRKSEKGGNKSEEGGDKSEEESSSSNKRSRGQQRGSKGHGRRDYSHLQSEEEEHDLVGSDCACPKCGLPFEPLPGTEDSEVIEVEVRAYRRIIKRKRYTPGCKCNAVPGVVTAPLPPKLIQKGLLGVSFWVMALLG